MTGPYCRFGKRDLDGMSWLAPLVNNPVGDRLNLELRHEQLFFIDGDRVTRDVGYSEKGTRFSEADYGKPIESLDDLKANGYWLAGRTWEPEVMCEALDRQQDGSYYSIFSNQCQDWVDRLKRTARRVEKERGIDPPEGDEIADEKPVSPTEPASILMGVVALVLGLVAMIGPYVAGHFFTWFMGGVFVASGISHAVYAFHARDWRNLVAILLMAAGYGLAGAFLLVNRAVAMVATTNLIAVVLGLQGAGQVALAARSRPFLAWIGTFVAGLAMVACALMVLFKWPGDGQRFLGLVVGSCLLIGGWSTIWLSWQSRRAKNS